MADAVVNHVSAQGTWFRALPRRRPGVRRLLRPAPGGRRHRRAVVRPRTTPLAHESTSPPTVAIERVWTTFSADQVDLDFANPAVLLAMVEVLLRYVHHGARAIRLDAIAFVWKDPATPSVHLPADACHRAAVPRLPRRGRTRTSCSSPRRTCPTPRTSPTSARHGDREAEAVYQFALPPLVLHAAFERARPPPLRAWLGASSSRLRPGARSSTSWPATTAIGVRPVEGLLRGDERRRASSPPPAPPAASSTSGRVDGVDAPLRAGGRLVRADGARRRRRPRRSAATSPPTPSLLALQGVPLLYLNSLFAIGNDTATYAAHRATAATSTARRLRPAAIDAASWPTATSARRAGVERAAGDARRLRRSSPAFHPAAAQVVHDSPDGTVLIERRASVGRACRRRRQPHRPAATWSTCRRPLARPGRPPAVDAAPPASSGTIVLEPWSSRGCVAQRSTDVGTAERRRVSAQAMLASIAPTSAGSSGVVIGPKR